MKIPYKIKIIYHRFSAIAILVLIRGSNAVTRLPSAGRKKCFTGFSLIPWGCMRSVPKTRDHAGGFGGSGWECGSRPVYFSSHHKNNQAENIQVYTYLRGANLTCLLPCSSLWTTTGRTESIRDLGKHAPFFPREFQWRGVCLLNNTFFSSHS